MNQLSLYNGALLHLGERFLASLVEEREPRRLLDHVWSNNGVRSCLEQGQWNFAMRTIQADYDSGISPSFGYQRGFQKPTDWVLTSALCSDESFLSPLTRYFDEADYWYADLDTIYVRYVSDDVLYGMNMNKWPDSFSEYVTAHFAFKIAKALTGSQETEDKMKKKCDDLLLIAKSRAMMAGPVQFPPSGSWTSSRGGRSSSERGFRSGNLY